MESSLQEDTECIRCERTPIIDQHKGDPILICPDCGDILVRNPV